MAAASLQSMKNFWKEFNLPELQKTLDTTATELADRQDESETSRKKLVELSRDFKKNTPEELRKKVAPLLKSFQAEIDALSKRSKASEAAFLTIYKKLVDVPDPLPALEQAQIHQQKASKIQDYEIENKKLRETLDEYNTEFAEVKNQEVTINKLKEKIKEYEEKIEERVQSKVKEREKELQKEFAEKEKQLRETQVSVARKLGVAEHKTATLQAALDNTQTELFDVKTKYDEVTAARSSEIEILESDLDRAQQRALSAERELQSVKEDLLDRIQVLSQDTSDHKNTNVDAAIDAISRSTLEHELTAKERQISQLVSDVQHLQATITRLKDGNALEVNRLEEQISAKTSSLQALEQRLSHQEDYEEVKRELSVLKMIEFSTSLEEEEIKEATPKSLEIQFMDKNKRLQSENTNLKVENSELSARYQDLNRQYKETAHTVSEQKELITQLECDLLSVNALPTAYRGQGEGQASPPSETELVATAVQHTMSPTSDESTDKSAVDSLLPIVASQRKRFKLRNMELEAQTRHQQQQISVLQNEVDSLRSDNVKLYEKIKFLESYPTKGSSAKDDEAAFSRYSSQYEQRLDPFAAFSQREKQQRYMGLSPHEKVTLNMGRFLLGNKMARTISFFYLLLLHLLVFLVLYKMAHTESCKRDTASECAKRFAEHMLKAHNQH
ncbi:protein CASP-like [Actinia tenebrosa]|uniref:Protein CASP n=1 Tax=Actinia tenebrosa TaxID=6105 RepID=A0A6P8I008_ACTTE|nr:protein CASP-like [Actinia tenebrosa]